MSTKSPEVEIRRLLLQDLRERPRSGGFYYTLLLQVTDNSATIVLDWGTQGQRVWLSQANKVMLRTGAAMKEPHLFGLQMEEANVRGWGL